MEPFIKLPLTATILDPIPLEPVTAVANQSDLTMAIKPTQKAADIISRIDINRISSERKNTKSSAAPYGIVELKQFAKELGIKGNLKKAQYVEEILRVLGYN